MGHVRFIWAVRAQHLPTRPTSIRPVVGTPRRVPACRAGANDSLAAILTACVDECLNLFAVHISELDPIRTTDAHPDVPGWRIWRWWPGEGSRAMAWCVRKSCVDRVLQVSSLVRAQLLLCRRGPLAQGHLRVVAHHAPHDGDQLASHLADLATLAAGGRRRSPWIVVGDTYADMCHPGTAGCAGTRPACRGTPAVAPRAPPPQRALCSLSRVVTC